MKVTRPQAGGQFTLKLTFTQPPAITVAPAVVSFGTRCLSASAPDQRVTVRNTGAASLTVSDFGLAGSGATDFAVAIPPVRPVILQPGAGVSVAVSFRPSALGARLAELLITSARL